jgi:site-specific DNA-methyltransferase (adenine-specific)
MSVDLKNIDCMKYMASLPDKAFDLACVDPPYGINIAKEKPRKSGRWNYGDPKDWDSAVPDKKYFDELFRVSKNQIIWGGNYFVLPPSRCWIVWDKLQPAKNFADAELAWCSIDSLVRIFRYSFAANKNKIHITQKPVALYNWLLHTYAKKGDRILDTHLGSGSSAIAAHYKNFDFVGCEIDKDYYNKAVSRIDEETRQIDIDLF